MNSDQSKTPSQHNQDYSYVSGTLFCGETAATIIELKNHANKLDMLGLLQELGEAHAKIGLYERRIREMAGFMGIKS